jgi:hypothetical protein
METPNQGEVEASHPVHVGHEVTVIVDGVKKEVPKGTYLVSQFKALVGVDPAKELDEVVHGQLKPLDDNAQVTIKGHEQFVSHVRTGGSS